MNHDGGATVGEDGVVVTAKCNVRGNYRRVTRAVGGHDQRKIGNVTGGQADMIDVPGGAVEVRSGGLEVRGLTFRVLMDVERMLAWRQALHVQLDLHSMGGFGENGGSDTLPFRVLDFNGNRF